MNEKRQDLQAGGMSVGDVYFILFRQKWIILAFSLLGIVGAGLLLFVIKPPQYQSNAMISIRYVVEGKSLNPPGDQLSTRTLDLQRDSIINTEVATLFSFDLAKEVVQAITPERILATEGGGTNVNWAASLVKNGLIVEPLPESSVIRVTFQSPDAALVQPILSEILVAYQHVQLHQGLGVPDESLTNEVVQLQAQLVQTDAELSKLKNANGVVSVEETQKGYADQISKIRQEIFSAEVELSGYRAVVGQLTKLSGAKPETSNSESATEIPSDQVDTYRRVCVQLASLQAREQNYLTVQGFTMENVLVQQVRGLINQYETTRKNLEGKYPQLVTLDVPASETAIPQPGDASFDLRSGSEQVAALEAKIQVLNSQLNQVWSEATNFDRVRTTISELEEKRDLAAANLKYFQNNLEQTRINEALGEDKAANISIIQWPTPPAKGWSKAFKKKVGAVAVGGVLAGVALAFFIELFLDRTIKRPTEIETKLQLPLFISIPDLTKNGFRRLAPENDRLLLQDAGGNRSENSGKNTPHPAGVDPMNRQNPLRRFCEGLRDRLIVYFEVRNLVHKPKLIGVTSCAKGAGVSSIATGLAASLSEMGEGNVLLVDMNVEGGAAQHFHKGKPNCGLESALKTETKANALVQENLYVAAEPMRTEALPQVLPKRFAGLISQIRNSGYDYIIFDMPPVAETTMTFRLARLMDQTLLVIEAGKTNQEVVKRVAALLAESKANVSTVLNKARTYAPRWLHQEFLDSM
ncbi:MAG: Wzz/FepE/Etk N-terminal domain-containing protein [Verrucomicrobiia bacterium]